METDERDSETNLGFSLRRLALVLLFLFAARGAAGGIRAFVVHGNWLAGFVGAVVIGVVAFVLFRLLRSGE